MAKSPGGKTHLVCVFSDVHFPNEHRGAWKAFRQWHSEHCPDLSIALGDIIDLGMLSVYDKPPDEPMFAIPQIKRAVQELNSLNREAKFMYMLPGNHEARWYKALLGKNAPKFRGAKGLSLKEQFYAQGLDKSIKWTSEGVGVPGEYVGKRACLVRHGDKQARGWGIRNIASALLNRNPGRSTVVGHHHRAEVKWHTNDEGAQACAIANPHLSGEHDYALGPNWQRGFTVLEFYGAKRLRDCTRFTPYVIVTDERGQFCWRGKIYG